MILLTGFLPLSAAASMHLYRHTPSSQSRVYWVTQLRTDGVHCRESVGTGPVVLKVVPVTGAAFAGLTMDQSMCVCVVFSSHPFWSSSSLDVPAGVTQEEGHTGVLIHLPSAVRALIFVSMCASLFPHRLLVCSGYINSHILACMIQKAPEARSTG